MGELRSITPTAKKNYKCMFCGGIINIGEKYNRSTQVNDGKIYDWVCHIHCYDLVTHLAMYEYSDNDTIDKELFNECISDRYRKITEILNYQELLILLKLIILTLNIEWK